ncbi:MAG TPA: response regulator, partial [Jatrophihabitans sp.]
MRVLVVDDEPQIVRALAINLRARRYEVDTAASGGEALLVAAKHPPDVVLLDLGLPDMDGVDVIAGIRGWLAVPIIVLSGRIGGSDKVAALDAGADDYVTKPFGMDELMARMRAVSRRASADQGAAQPLVTIGDHTVDLASRRVSSTDGG